MRLLFVCLLFLGCANRPLEMPCSTGEDCPGSGCVHNWWDDGTRTPANVCAESCSTDADCGEGKCVRVGDAVTLSREALLFACR